jgi:predicted RNA-binding Zn-ribbon protein involved in translation (DUF1610 family)
MHTESTNLEHRSRTFVSDHICPVCGSYGISLRDKAQLRLLGHDLTCRACGTQLTVDYWDSIVALVPFFACVGVGLLLDSLIGLLVCAMVGLGISWWWSIRKVPLVPTGRHTKFR